MEARGGYAGGMMTTQMMIQSAASVGIVVMMALSFVGALQKRRGKGTADWKRPGVVAALAGAMVPGSSQLMELLPGAGMGFLLCGIMALLGWGVGYVCRPR